MAERKFIVTQRGIKAAFRAAYQIAQEAVATGDYELILRARKSKRSIEQNKRYWAILREISANVWIDGRRFSDSVWHEHFKRIFIGADELVMPDGCTEVRGISTTKLSVQEFGDYMTQIEVWAAEQGYPVGEAA